MENAQYYNTLDIALVICRNHEGKWLAVNECGGQGWWLPGGLVDPPENHYQAAVRETIEEAGVNVKLKGVLRVEYATFKKDNYQRFKVIFYAEPEDPKQEPKSKPDKESLEARWVSISDLVELSKTDVGLRGPELYEWATYIEKGGTIYPLSILTLEGAELQQTRLDNDVIGLNRALQASDHCFDAQEVAAYRQAIENRDDSWFFQKDAAMKLERYIDEDCNSFLAIAVCKRESQIIKMALLMSNESLFRVNKLQQNILILAIKHHFDKSVFTLIINAVKNNSNSHLREQLLLQKDSSSRLLVDYIQSNSEVASEISEILQSHFPPDLLPKLSKRATKSSCLTF